MCGTLVEAAENSHAGETVRKVHEATRRDEHMRVLRVLLLTVIAGTQVYAESILIPLSSRDIEGAHGSAWSTEVLIANGSDHPIDIKYQTCVTSGPCPITFSVQPGETRVAPVDRRRPDEPPGILLHVQDSDAQFLTVTNRLQERSREFFSWGTTIPVVREHEFFARPLNLLAVPLHERYRLSLRIYQNTNDTDAFTVRIFSGSGQLLGQHVIHTLASDATDNPEPRAGAAAQVHSYETMLRTAAEGYDAVRLEISPAKATTRFWAFISIINNEAQHVTIITSE